MDLLAITEQQLCTQNRLLPAHYLRMKEVLMLESLKGSSVKRSDAYRFKLIMAKWMKCMICFQEWAELTARMLSTQNYGAIHHSLLSWIYWSRVLID